MLTKFVIGPTLEELRPLKHASDTQEPCPDFPVYLDLVDRLLDARQSTTPDPIARHVCAVLSSWSYSDPDTVAAIMARLGLFENRCWFVEVSNNGMLVRSTAYLVQSKCRRVAFLVYRGTDPFDLSTWGISSDVNPVMVPVRDNAQGRHDGKLPLERVAAGTGTGDPEDDVARVHGGFYRNQRATWFALTQPLRNAATGKSIAPKAGLTPEQDARERENQETLEREGQLVEGGALFITGHSLGGAMAIVAAYKLCSDPQYVDICESVAQVYTFAQPMVGNLGFKAAWERGILKDRLFCHAYENDVVPHLPPADTRHFQHVGTHYASVPRKRVDASTPDRQWEGPTLAPAQAGSWTVIAASFVQFAAVQLVGLEALLDALARVQNALGDAARLLRRVLESVLRHRPEGAGGSTARARRYSIYDHMPQHYVACSQPNHVLTEFGDDF